MSLPHRDLRAVRQLSGVIDFGALAKTDFSFDRILIVAIENDASDILWKVGSEPLIKLGGINKPLSTVLASSSLTPPLRALDTAAVALALVKDDPLQQASVQHELNTNGSADIGFTFSHAEKKYRFRVNIFKGEGGLGISMRLLPIRIPPFEDLGLPTQLQELALGRGGLILVTGPTGSGKSTTLASLTQHRAKNNDGHIITLENPIEYLIDHAKGAITQREMGRDFPDFETALRAALRENPDTIVVGEIRDFETVRTAVTAAETGHLVMATLHTIDAPRSVERMIDFFSGPQQDQIRTQIAAALQGVCCQQLLPRKDGKGRVLAYEFLLVGDNHRNNIRERKTNQIRQYMNSPGSGMQQMDAHLAELVRKDIITKEVALRSAAYPLELKKALG